MNLVFLTQQGGILGPFAWIMGVILNAIYELVSLIGINNIAICVVLFTFVIRSLMLPLTIKQQKFTKLSSKMNPEITKIQEKYKNKKDEVSLRKQQMELQEVYTKYGTNPMSGCLPMLITLPILFALYRVIYKVPAYINDVNALYSAIASSVSGIDGYTQAVKDFLETINASRLVSDFKEEAFTVTHLIDIFTNFDNDTWSAFFNLDTFKSLSDTIVSINNSNMTLSAVRDEIIHVNAFVGGMSILDTPGYTFPGVLVPAIATLLYFIQNKMLVAGSSKSNDVDNPMAQSMKSMNTVMPIISGVFCMFIPIGVGLYLIAGSIYQIFQQMFLNHYMDSIGIDEMIEKNIEKSEESKKKYGIERGSKMANVAKTSTKSLDNNLSENTKKKTSKKGSSDYKKREVSYSADKIAAIANILKEDDEN